MGALLYGGFFAPRRGVACNRTPHAGARANVPADHHVLDCRKIGKQANVLKRAGDTERCDTVRRQLP